MQNKEISSLANPELKFLISLKKNKLRRQEQKSLAEGYRENLQLISSNYEIDTLYICREFFIGENNHCLLYTSDAADDTPCVDLGGRRIIKKTG